MSLIADRSATAACGLIRPFWPVIPIDLTRKQQSSARSWWQTAAGVMTGIAALTTAITGLIVALVQTGVIGGHERKNEASTAAAHDHPSSNTSRANVPEHTRQPGAVIREPVQTEEREQKDVHSPRSIALPAQREYVLGNRWSQARYILAAATLTSHSRESDTLSVKIRLQAEGEPGYTSQLSSSQFTLVVDEKPIKAAPFFSEYVRSGESIERELRFTVAPQRSRAELRIKIGVDSRAEIALDLTSAAGDSSTH